MPQQLLHLLGFSFTLLKLAHMFYPLCSNYSPQIVNKVRVTGRKH